MKHLWLAILCLAAGPVQDSGPDRVVTTAGEAIQGEIVKIEADGALEIKTSKESRTVRLDDVHRLVFSENAKIEAEKSGEKLYPRFGGALTGSVVSVNAEKVTFKSTHGTYAIKRDEVRALSFAKVAGEVKEIKEDQDLLLLAPDPAKPNEPVAVTGRLESLDATSARVGGADVPRARIHEIRFRGVARPEPSAGVFARVQLKNGDGLVGMLRQFEAARVHLFTHYAGVVTLEKKAIHSIAMVPLARLQFGHILIFEKAGLREIDRQGNTVWTYGENAVGCTSAKKLPNGNVLIANGNRGMVFEVRPTGIAGGQVVWMMEDLPAPWDALKLDNGNVLVAEYGSTRVAEYDPKERTVKRSTQLQGNPTGLERLEDGGALVSMNYGPVTELDAKGTIRLRYSVAGQNEYRATRTAEGTTLIADQRGSQVVEVDRKNAILWKYTTPQPRLAVRLDDGNTLIFRRNGSIIEVDSRGHQQAEFKQFDGATGFSVY